MRVFCVLVTFNAVVMARESLISSPWTYATNFKLALGLGFGLGLGSNPHLTSGSMAERFEMIDAHLIQLGLGLGLGLG